MMNIKRMRIDELRPAAYNPRVISDEAMDGLRFSIKRWGLVEPVVWNRRTGNVVGGHQRLKVLMEEGVEETDVVVVDLEISEEKALNVALNSGTIAGKFTDGLRTILSEIDLEPIERMRLDDLVYDLVELEEEEGGGKGEGGKEWHSVFTVYCGDEYTEEVLVEYLDTEGYEWEEK